MYATPEDTKYNYCSQQIETAIAQAKRDGTIVNDKPKARAISELIQNTDRRYFNKHLFHHFLFFFTQIPLPFIMEKLLNWINSDPQEVRNNGAERTFVHTGVFYASMMIALYLVKCTAEIS